MEYGFIFNHLLKVSEFEYIATYLHIYGTYRTVLFHVHRSMQHTLYMYMTGNPLIIKPVEDNLILL